MSYDIYIWDPARHAPLPANSDEAYDTRERLSELKDGWNSTMVEFGNALVARFEANPRVSSGGLTAFWGADPRKTIANCKTAAVCLSLPMTECVQQVADAIEAAATLGLVVYDDDVGACFLPDGNILPEDMKAIWAKELAELAADIADPHRKKGDGRTFWERLGGELFDALGRGNKSR